MTENWKSLADVTAKLVRELENGSNTTDASADRNRENTSQYEASTRSGDGLLRPYVPARDSKAHGGLRDVSNSGARPQRLQDEISKNKCEV